MKVVRKGNAIKRAICYHCDAELEFTPADENVMTLTSSLSDNCYRDTHIAYVTCPECGEKIYLDLEEVVAFTPNLIG